MSIVQMPITGRTSGKFATAVFAKNFQKNTMRAKALPTTVPATNLQTSQREAFKKITNAVRSLQSLSKIGLFHSQQKMSSYSKAMQLSLKEAVSGVAGSRVVDFSKLVFSSGDRKKLNLLSKVYSGSSGSLTIGWSPVIESPTSSPTDSVAVGIYTPSNGYSFVNTNAALVSHNSLHVNLDDTKVDADTVFFVFPYILNQTLPEFKNDKFKAGAELAGKVK